MPPLFIEDRVAGDPTAQGDRVPADRQRPRVDLSVPRILGGALAAASAAIASSWLGLAGTVLGAAVVSVVATVGTAVYAHSLERSRLVLREMPVRAARSRLVSTEAGQSKHPMPDLPTQQTGSPTARTRALAEPVMAAPAARRIRWGAVAVTAVVTLVVGLGLLTAFEFAVGRSAGSLTGSGGGGTTVGRLLGVQHASDSGQQPPSGHRPSNAPTHTAPTEPATTVPTTPTPTQPTEPTQPTQPTTPTEPTQPTSPTAPTEPPTGGSGGAHSAD